MTILCEYDTHKEAYVIWLDAVGNADQCLTTYQMK